jgi:hypothetical protein
MPLSPEEKKLDKLNRLFELVNEEYATPDDLIKLSEAILGIITTERERLDSVIASEKEEDKQEKAEMLSLLNKKEASLQNLIASLRSDIASDRKEDAQALSQATQSLRNDIKAVERKIPTKTDLSGLEREIADIKDSFNTLPTELTLNNEAIRDGLELLQDNERLDKSAIKGLDDWEEIVQLARSPKTINGAGVKLLRYLSDVNIDGITNGQTIIWNSTTNRFEPGTGGGSSSPLTTKGDIYTYDTAGARLAVGTDGQVLSADSTQATGLKWIGLAGGGDMVLAAAQMVSGLKTYLAGTLGLRNVANTFTSFFTNTNTASRTYTLQDVDGTVAHTVQAVDFEVTDTTKGVIIKSANGTRWRIGITNNGELTAVSL